MKIITEKMRWCAVLSLVLSMLALWSWCAGVADLFTFGPRQVPMAPSTSLVLALASVAVLARRPMQKGAVWLGYGAATAVGAVGVLACARWWFGWSSPVEEMLSQTTERVGQTPLGQMSPLTGAAFVVTAAALFLRLPPHGERPIARFASKTLVLLLVLFSGAVALSYITGNPWFYGGSTIPMALWTALCLLSLGAGLLVTPVVSDSREKESPPDASRGPAGVAVALATVVGLVGAFYLRHEQTEIRDLVHEQIKSIGRVKADLIAQWRSDRLNDASFFAKTAFVRHEVQTFLAQPSSPEARVEILQWFALVQGGKHFSFVGLFDTHFMLRLSLPERGGPPQPNEVNLLKEALQTRQTVMGDLHRNDNAGEIRMDIAVPILSSKAGSVGEPMGVILLQIDPRDFLHPLIQAWPTESRSAETLLVRREGNDVVFLNELRHKKNSALNMRLPVDPMSQLPASMVVLGRTGLVEGVDYRGVPVLADVRSVQNSPWSIVSKVDRDEVYASLRQRARLVLALTAALAAAVWLLVWLFWSRRELAAERQRHMLVDRIQHLMKSANDAILLTDKDWRVLEANDRVLEWYGYSMAELMQMPAVNLRVPQMRTVFNQEMEQVRSRGHALLETVHQRKNGSMFPVEASYRIVTMGGVWYGLVVIRDITQRKVHEREIERMTRLYATLSQVNQVIVRVKSQEELAGDVCRVAVEFGGFQLAWLGQFDPKTEDITVLGCAGHPEDFIQTVRQNSGERTKRHCLFSPVIPEGRPAILNDVRATLEKSDWQMVMERAGVRATAEFPVRLQDNVWGVFSVYANEPDIFQDKEIALLVEAAMDIGFAVEQLQNEARRQQAETRTRENELLLRQVIDLVPHHIFAKDRNGRFLFLNRAAANACGRQPQEMVRRLESEIRTDTLHVEKFLRDDQEVIASGTAKFIPEEPITYADGSVHYLQTTKMPFTPPGTSEQGVLGVSVDITERKRADEALAAANERLQSTLANMAQGYYAIDRDWRVVAVNDVAERHFGKPASELIGGTLEQATQGRIPDNVRKGIKQVMASAQPQHFEVQSKVRPGTWATDYIYPLDGGVEVYFTDITERKRAEEALLESEEYFRTMFEVASIGLAQTNPRTRQFVRVNQKMTEITGYSAGELLQMCITDLSYPDDLSRDREFFDWVVRGEAPSCHTEKRYVRKDGAVIWASVNATVIRDAAGQPTHAMAAIEDITARKQVEIALCESEKRLRTVGDNIPGGALYQLLLPSQGQSRYTYISAGFERIFGIPVENIMNDPWAFWDLIVTEDKRHLEEVQERCARQMTVFDCEFRQRTATGEMKWIHARSTPRRLPDGSILWDGVAADVTERKQAEEEVNKLNAELEQRVRERTAQLEFANKELEAFSYSVSHDLRAPLRAINGFASVLTQEHARQLDEEGRRTLGVVCAEAERMGQLIDDLLEFSRMGRQAMLKSEVDMHAEAQTAFDRCIADTSDRDIWLKLHPLPRSEGDRAMFSHVWTNLISNAIKYTRTRPVAEIEISGQVRGNELVYCVKDNGVGFDMKYTHKLFAVFQRLHSEEDFEGTGVGLALVERIVRRHGGNVWAEGKVGEGAAFYFSLPCVAAPAA
ncbi:MAG: PAS domain S-box protein [Verrucomicrobiia bacterium]